jgi:hypothetical protein
MFGSSQTEEGYMSDEFEALQRMRKEEIEKLERDLIEHGEG